MNGYMYYCKDCKKLFKISAEGKKAKCPKCSQPLLDLKISDEEYASLDKAGKEAIKERVTDKTIKEDNVTKQDTNKDPINTVSSNVIAAKNSEKLKQVANINSIQHATFNNTYLKTQIQAQILAADNFVSICKMSALKNDGVIDKDEDKLIKKVVKLTADYTGGLKKLI